MCLVSNIRLSLLISSKFHAGVATDRVVLRYWNHLGEAYKSSSFSLGAISFSGYIPTGEVGRKLALVSTAHASGDTTLRVLLRSLVHHALGRVVKTKSDLRL